MAVIRKLPVRVEKIVSHSDDIKHFTLSPQKRLPRFKAGQFLHLAIEAYNPSFNWPESRVFSIANSPTRKETIELLVSRKGSFTNKLFDKVKEGDELWVKLPFGTFNYDDSMSNDTVLIAGGTGVSPFNSFIEYAIDLGLNPAIKLYYGVRKKELIIYNDLFQQAKNKLDSFDYSIYVEELNENEESETLFKGQLNVKSIIEQSLKLNQPYYYLSGPPGMIQAFKTELENHDIDSVRIKFDNWE